MPEYFFLPSADTIQKEKKGEEEKFSAWPGPLLSFLAGGVKKGIL